MSSKSKLTPKSLYRVSALAVSAAFVCACGAPDVFTEGPYPNSVAEFDELGSPLQAWSTLPEAAARFDGVDDYFEVTSANLEANASDFTLGAWVRIPPSTSSGTLVGNNLASASGAGGAHDYPGYRLLVNSGPAGVKLEFFVDDSNSQGVVSIPAPRDDNWHHVVAVRTASNLQLWLDGALVGTTAWTAAEPIISGYPFTIGASKYWTTAAFFTGSIDNVSFHKRALSAAEIPVFTLVGPNVRESTLEGYWTFDGGAGKDASSKKRDATPRGGPTSTAGSRLGESALRFNGTSDGIRYSTAATPDAVESESNFSTADFTVSFYTKIEQASGGDQTLVGRGATSSTTAGYRLSLDAGVLRFDLNSTSAPYRLESAVGALKVGRWHHVTATRTGKTAILYLDGVNIAQRDTGAAALNVTSQQPLSIGASFPSVTGAGSKFFLGGIDNVVLLNKALSASEVETSRRQGPASGDANLVKLLPFTFGSVADVASFARPGLVVGNPQVIAGARLSRPELDRVLSGYHVPTALRFNAGSATNGVNVTSAAALNLAASNFTFGANLRVATLPATGTSQVLAGTGTLGASQGYRLVLVGPRLGLELGNGSSVLRVTSASNITSGRWFSVAVQRSEQTVRLYVNGVQVASGTITGTVTDASSPFRIGGDGSSANRFKGDLHGVSLQRRALSVAELAELAKLGPDVDDAALAGYWPLQDGSASDLGPNALVSQVSGTPETVFGQNLGRRALSFNGTTNYASVTSPLLSLGTGNFTLSGQFKATNAASATVQTLIDKGFANTSGSRFRVSLSAGKVKFEARAGSASIALTSNTVVDNGWHHFAVVRKPDGANAAGRVHLYVDGKYEGNVAISSSYNFSVNDTLVMGATGVVAPSNFFTGSLDAIAVYRRDLLGREFRMERDFGPDARDPGLIAYYPFDYGSGLDMSTNELHATLKGPRVLTAGADFQGHSFMLGLAEASAGKGFNALPAGPAQLQLGVSKSVTYGDVSVIDATPPTLTPHPAFTEAQSDGLPAGTPHPYAPAGLPTFQMDYFDTTQMFMGEHITELLVYGAEHGFGRSSFVINGYLPQPTSPSDPTRPSQRALMAPGISIDGLLHAHNKTDISQLTESAAVVAGWLAPALQARLTGWEVTRFDFVVPDTECTGELAVCPHDTVQPHQSAGYIRFHEALAQAVRGYPSRGGNYGFSPIAWGLTPESIPASGIHDFDRQNWDAHNAVITSLVDTVTIGNYIPHLTHPVYRALAKVVRARRLMDTKADTEVKPLLPFTHHTYTAGWDTQKWWYLQPLRDEDARAETVLSLFGGADGLVSWSDGSFFPQTGASGGQNVNLPPMPVKGKFGIAALGFTATRPSGTSRIVKRYEPLYVREFDAATNIVTYQVGNRDATGEPVWGDHMAGMNPTGTPATFPEYRMTKAEWLTRTRVPASGFVGMFEGLAFAKVLERALYNGTPRQDVPLALMPQESPALRIQYGPYQLLAAYNEYFEAGETRALTIPNFAGVANRNLTVDTDSKTRAWIFYPTN